MRAALEDTWTYFQNRMTKDDLIALLTCGRSFFLENVGSMETTTAFCAETLIQLGHRCRIEDKRASWAADAQSFLPWPLHIAVAFWKSLKDATKQQPRVRTDVVLVQSLGAIHVQFPLVKEARLRRGVT